MELRPKILQEDEEDLTCLSVVADNISLCNGNEEDDDLEEANRPWGRSADAGVESSCCFDLESSSSLSPLPLDIKGDDDNDKFEDGAKQKQKSSNNIKLPLSNKCSTAIALVFVIGIFAAALTASLRESTHESSRVSSQQQQVVTVASGRSSCDGKSLQIDLETDNYGFETSWKLEVLNPDKNNRYEQIESGPPLPTKYADNTRYIGVYCLSNPGRYKFTINDLFQDGMCCEFGQGSYTGYLNGVKAFSSPDDGDEDWTMRSHPFTIEAEEEEVTAPVSTPVTTADTPVATPVTTDAPTFFPTYYADPTFFPTYWP